MEHALEALVYAPVGLLFEGSSLLPQLIEKGRNQVTMARMIGKFAVDQGRVEATKAASRLQDQAAGVLEFIGGSVTVPVSIPPPPRRPPSRPTRPGSQAPAPLGQAARKVAGVVPRTPRPPPSAQQRLQRRPRPRGGRRHAGHPGLRRPLGIPRGEPPRRACRPPSSRRCARTRRPTGAARRSSPRSPSCSPRDRWSSARGGLPTRRRGRPAAAGRARRPGGRRAGRPAGAARCGPARVPGDAPFEEGLEADLADPTRHVLVGTVDGTVMGYGVAAVSTLRRRGPPRCRRRPLHRPRVPRARDR